MSFSETQWIHWKKYNPEFNGSKPWKIKATNNVSANNTNLSYGFKLDLSLEDKKPSAGFVRLKLVWEIMGMNENLNDAPVKELKLENSSIKILMRSVDGQDRFLKWLHLDATGNKKTISWKTFIPKTKYHQMTISKENKSRAASCEVTFFGRLSTKLPKEKVVISPDEVVFEAASTLSIPCELSSCDSEATKVTLTIEGSPEQQVVVNKFHLAGVYEHICMDVQSFSPVFGKKFFEGDVKEKCIIKVKGISFLVLKTFVSLIGGFKPVGKEVLEMGPEVLFKVLYMAHLYEIEGVIDICKIILMAIPDSNMGMADAYNLFHVGKILNIPEFTTRCFEWIERKGVDALKREGTFALLKEDTVKEFLTEFCYYLLH